MSYKPNDSYYTEFTTSNPTTGAAANADSLPVATANHNGTDDGTFTLTVTNIDTGRYKVTGTIPSGYAKGDVVNVTVAATCSSVAGKARIDSFVLDSKRVGDLNDLGGTAQTGDAYAYLGTNLGALGANATALAPAATALSTAQWTNTRAAKLDNLDVASSVLQTAINNLNNLSALANLYGPQVMEIPDSSSTSYPFTLTIRDSEGHLVALDASPTITAANAAGTDRSANLSAVTNPSTGVYQFTYSVASNAAEEGLRIAATGAVSSSARRADFSCTVANYDSITTLAAIKAKTDNLPSDPASEASVEAAITSATNTLATDITNGDLSVTLATSQPNYAPSKAGDKMDIVNAPNATAVTAIQSGLATHTDATTIEGAITALGSPAQAGDAMTLTTGERTTLAAAIWGAATSGLTATGSIGLALVTLIGKFSGMTSLAQWLGLIAGNQTGNSTALTELNATGAGSGTYDPTKDSTQAIRERGDVAWITGSGGGSGGDAGADDITDATTYPAGTLGGSVRQILAQTNLIKAGGITVASPVDDDGGITIWKGADMTVESGLQIDVPGTGPDLTGATIVFLFTKTTQDASNQFDGEMATVDGAQVCRLELTHTESAEFTKTGQYTHQVQVTYADGTTRPWAEGTTNVRTFK